jgi:hypothetical protein
VHAVVGRIYNHSTLLTVKWLDVFNADGMTLKFSRYPKDTVERDFKGYLFGLLFGDANTHRRVRCKRLFGV